MKDREPRPRIATPLEIAKSRLPSKIRTYLSYDQQASDLTQTEDYRFIMGHRAQDLLGSFSRLDQRALTDFVAFRREYNEKHRTRMDDIMGRPDPQ